jgi:hypothetical protein
MEWRFDIPLRVGGVLECLHVRITVEPPYDRGEQADWYCTLRVVGECNWFDGRLESKFTVCLPVLAIRKISLSQVHMCTCMVIQIASSTLLTFQGRKFSLTNHCRNSSVKFKLSLYRHVLLWELRRKFSENFIFKSSTDICHHIKYYSSSFS